MVSPHPRRIKYVGLIDPISIATWLRQDVGLTAFNVVARFAPFAHWSFDANTLHHPRATYSTLALGEAPPTISDDTLSEFFGNDNLEWTLAHGPHGPHLQPRVVDNPAAALSKAPADASSSQ